MPHFAFFAILSGLKLKKYLVKVINVCLLLQVPFSCSTTTLKQYWSVNSVSVGEKGVLVTGGSKLAPFWEFIHKKSLSKILNEYVRDESGKTSMYYL